MLDRKAHGQTFGQALRTMKWQMFWTRFSNLGGLVSPLFLIFTGGVIWLLPSTLQSRNPLGLLQFALLGGFVISFYILASFTASLRAVRFFGTGTLTFFTAWFPTEEDPADKAAAAWVETEYHVHDPTLDADIKEREDRPAYPRISLGNGISRAVHGYFLRTLMSGLAINVVMFLSMLLISYPFALLSSSSAHRELNTWYEHMAQGAVLAPLAFLILLAVAFYALESFVLFVTVVLTAVLGSAIPLAAAHWARTRITAADLSTSVAAGVSSALVLLISEVLRRRSESGKPAE
jgi:hypothetical protein